MVSESARKARFSSPARSGQRLGMFKTDGMPPEGVRGDGGSRSVAEAHKSLSAS